MRFRLRRLETGSSLSQNLRQTLGLGTGTVTSPTSRTRRRPSGRRGDRSTTFLLLSVPLPFRETLVTRRFHRVLCRLSTSEFPIFYSPLQRVPRGRGVQPSLYVSQTAPWIVDRASVVRFAIGGSNTCCVLMTIYICCPMIKYK